MFKGTILVVDDTPGKRRKVRMVAESKEYEVIETSVLEVAQNYLKENEVEGIVLDSQFFLKEGDKDGADDAGNQMLDWLQKEGKEILVLGFSNRSFQTTYSRFWGKMGDNMLFDKNIFEKFLFSLPTKKDQG